jgi:hypothetical protein
MSQSDASESQQVTAAANRLRLVASDFAEASPEERRRYFMEEIDRALAVMPPAQRRDFLKSLEERFPAWNSVIEPAPDAASGAAAAQSPTDERELRDPALLVKRLCALAPQLTPEAKRGLAEQLRNAGVISQAAILPWSDELIAGLTSRLQLGEQRKIDPAKVFELTTLLVEFTCGLHQLVGTAWRTLAPAADIKYRPGSVQTAMGKYLTGDKSVPREALAQEVEKMRQLVASILAAVGEAGRKVARSQFERFAPVEIRNAAEHEPGFLVGVEAKCWRKYLELWNSMDEADIERNIRDTIANFAQSLLKGVVS